jgi:DNA-binding MarR family transcriptional regulator
MFDHCLYFNTTSLARKLEREWAIAFKPFELTPAQAFMLRVVLQKENASQNEIATEMNVTKSTATRTLDGLQNLKYIKRVVSNEDRRACELHATDKAIKLRDELNNASAEVTKKFKKLLGNDVFERVVGEIKAVSTRI